MWQIAWPGRAVPGGCRQDGWTHDEIPLELEMAGLIQVLDKHATLAKQFNSLQEIEKKSTAKTVEINHKLELVEQQIKSLEENIDKQNNQVISTRLNFDLYIWFGAYSC